MWKRSLVLKNKGPKMDILHVKPLTFTVVFSSIFIEIKKSNS